MLPWVDRGEHIACLSKPRSHRSEWPYMFQAVLAAKIEKQENAGKQDKTNTDLPHLENPPSLRFEGCYSMHVFS